MRLLSGEADPPRPVCTVMPRSSCKLASLHISVFFLGHEQKPIEVRTYCVSIFALQYSSI